ncbi:XTP/dITP diphosphohydrolase [Flexibacter flexilis DSM 6793]|uniref:Nucleoside triphosphate pyrophosphohydrolase n=1 Tax=Flexibacter flexilis DSM 6793 TaxID=927664 RepID=A0A1I1KTQ4_9BACT|nr:nucleoside triphosphate pyrophosphohydrolase [Flexibacter flexilis]SFC64169.1 XTP/dITP diphosphohydrolase [Flexibacter flexilis DSM 6793]
MPQIISTPDPRRAEKLAAFDRLLTIMDELRENCPWDKKQTMESLRHLTIEETYELGDAILNNDLAEIRKEIGDIMLHLVFYARIASETNTFDIADVLNGLCDKLVSRHPHIYGEAQADTEEQVKKNWESLKLKEKGNKGVLSGVPSSLPALIKAMRIQEKARGAGFDWDEKDQVWEKVQEELGEFQAETKAEIVDSKKVEGEFGDLLFSLINYSRFINVNPEEALERTNKKFIQRFSYLETESKADGKQLSTMTLDEMNEYWEKAKQFSK